jgi:hypothetical protein
MLAADQELLESQMKKQAVAIQNLELQYFVSNFDTAATCASLLAGFAFGGLGMSGFSGLLSQYEVVIVSFYGGVAVAFGSNFLCFILALLCRIQGNAVNCAGWIAKPIGIETYSKTIYIESEK